MSTFFKKSNVGATTQPESEEPSTTLTSKFLSLETVIANSFEFLMYLFIIAQPNMNMEKKRSLATFLKADSEQADAKQIEAKSSPKKRMKNDMIDGEKTNGKVVSKLIC